jgi:arginyl-tRNA synthetase
MSDASVDAKTRIERALGNALRDVVPGADLPIVLERPKQSAHGDYASNVALTLGKREKRNPRELAVSLCS